MHQDRSAGGSPISIVSALAVALTGCGSEKPPPERPRVYWSNSPPQCPVDHTREFFCDDLAPLTSGRPAPPPYESCPVESESHDGLFEPVPPVSVFDPTYTAHVRLRAPPGHSCCYSWCSRLELPVLSAREQWLSCKTVSAFREQFCIAEPELGTSAPANAYFPKCPAAIVPPEKAVFAVPSAAGFDAAATWDRRSHGQRDCCYAWCSQAPPASGLQGSGRQ